MSARTHAYLWLLVAYTCALAAGYCAYISSPFEDALWSLLFADVVGTITVFCFSFAFSNSSFYDPYWSVTPLIFTLVWWLGAAGHANDLRAFILMGLTGLWGMRLTFNFLRGFTDITHCDWRYRDLEEQHGKRFWLVSFFGIHFFSSSLVFMGSVPVYLAVTSSEPLGPLGWLGAAITLAAIAIESIADQQLHHFVKENTEAQNYIQTGLWAWSRHPNYFGEVSFWWGLALMGLSASGSLWSLLGASCMTAMFVFISIPLMETRMLGKRPHYAEHIQKVSVLVPWPPRQK